MKKGVDELENELRPELRLLQNGRRRERQVCQAI